jgi:hypothetical protein
MICDAARTGWILGITVEPDQGIPRWGWGSDPGESNA